MQIRTARVKLNFCRRAKQPGPEIPINYMLKSRAWGTFGCYKSPAVSIDFDTSFGPLTHSTEYRWEKKCPLLAATAGIMKDLGFTSTVTVRQFLDVSSRMAQSSHCHPLRCHRLELVDLMDDYNLDFKLGVGEYHHTF